MSEVRGTEEARKKLRQITPQLLGQIRLVFNERSALLASHIQSRHMTGGTTSDRLRTRSDNLRGSVRMVDATVEGATVTSGVQMGSVYGRVHVGPRGQKTVIKPKKGKFLAIPLKAAMHPSGVTKGAPQSSMWGETFFWRSKRTGKLILAGKRVIQKGAKAGMTKDEFLPLFLMVKQVTVPARVHPEDIVKWERPKLLGALKKIGLRFRAT